MPKSTLRPDRRKGNSKSTIQQRIDWLLEHPDKWERWTDHFDPRAQALVIEMKQQGLIAQSTYWRDVRLEVWIGLARKQRAIQAS